jgi:hypothetical protein
MAEKIRPYVVKIDDVLDDQERARLDSASWAVDWLVDIGDRNIVEYYERSHALKRLQGRLLDLRYGRHGNGSFQAELFFLVCSPEYAKRPGPDHDLVDTEHALVQETFDAVAARKYLIDAIANIGEVEPENLELALGKFLDVKDLSE